MFNDLYDAANDFLALPTEGSQLAEIRNDDIKARDAFCALNGSDFVSETTLMDFLEEAYEVIDDYDIAGYAELFKLRLREFIRKYNLRYRLDDPFKLRILFTNLYAELQRLNTSNGHLHGLLQDFEHSFDRYARTQDPSDLKTCIAKVSNYAEGLASSTHGQPSAL